MGNVGRFAVLLGTHEALGKELHTKAFKGFCSFALGVNVDCGKSTATDGGVEDKHTKGLLPGILAWVRNLRALGCRAAGRCAVV